MRISVVIPTRNRPDSLRRLLQSIQQQTLQVQEVIIIDSSDDVSYHQSIINSFPDLLPQIIKTDVCSVCVQRNMGIQKATSEWIFLCDDDLEVPADYLNKISQHIQSHPEAGAITGNVMQNNGKGNTWTEQYPITSSFDLLARFVFQLSIWGEIEIERPNFLVRSLEKYYKKKGNHLSKAGWPVITDFSGSYFRTPFYGLGASVVKKEWLINSPYDEVLDPHGIGDNFDVASAFPAEGIHVVKDAFVYHYRASENRLSLPEIYYRRMLALDYFLKTKKQLQHVSKSWFLWSLIGSMTFLLFPKNIQMIKVNLKLLATILSGNNAYLLG